MRATVGYAAASASLVGIVVAALWWVLDQGGRTGVLVAGLVALPLQIAAFAALLRGRERTNRFLAAWVGGTLMRMLVVVLVALVLVERVGLEPAPTLLALVGFFFGMLLLEPVFFGLREDGTSETR